MRALPPLLAALLFACGSDEPSSPPPDAAADANARDAGHDAAVDAGAFACACGGAEDCNACFERIGTCCYDDPTLGGQVSRLAATCSRTGTCSTCCDECAAQTCEQMQAEVFCPAADPP